MSTKEKNDRDKDELFQEGDIVEAQEIPIEEGPTGEFYEEPQKGAIGRVPEEEFSKEDLSGKDSTEEERLQRALIESDERFLRLAAEYENYRKRTSKEITESFPKATGETVFKFLPIMDDFQRSLEFEPNSDAFAEGISLIHKNLQGVFEQLGVETFGEVGDAFDPNLHNAIMHITSEDFGANEVSMVLQKGYKIGDRIIRHAMVQTAN